MNRIEKIVVGLLIGLGLLYFHGTAKADFPSEGLTEKGMQFTVLATSGSVFLRSGVVYQITASTGAITNYFQCFDTVPLNNFGSSAGSALSAYTTGQVVTPWSNFITTTTVSGIQSATMQKVYDWGNYGVQIINGFYCALNTTGLQIGVYWRK